MSQTFSTIFPGVQPVIAAAVHDGHEISPYLRPYMALNEQERLREEDPFTGDWTKIADTRIIANYSRFEVDLNRPREKAVYQKPEDAWGLQIWKDDLPEEIVQKSLAKYDQFYINAKHAINQVFSTHDFFVVYDLHTYNHLRDGEFAQPANPEGNPEVNIGTGNLDRAVWGEVVDVLIDQLRSFDFKGRKLDVRENVKFKGGYFSKWVQKEYGNAACPIAIEFKKFFMNEWTGEADSASLSLIQAALASTVDPVNEALRRVHDQILGH